MYHPHTINLTCENNIWKDLSADARRRGLEDALPSPGAAVQLSEFSAEDLEEVQRELTHTVTKEVPTNYGGEAPPGWGIHDSERHYWGEGPLFRWHPISERMEAVGGLYHRLWPENVARVRQMHLDGWPHRDILAVVTVLWQRQLQTIEDRQKLLEAARNEMQGQFQGKMSNVFQHPSIQSQEEKISSPDQESEDNTEGMPGFTAFSPIVGSEQLQSKLPEPPVEDMPSDGEIAPISSPVDINEAQKSLASMMGLDWHHFSDAPLQAIPTQQANALRKSLKKVNADQQAKQHTQRYPSMDASMTQQEQNYQAQMQEIDALSKGMHIDVSKEQNMASKSNRQNTSGSTRLGVLSSQENLFPKSLGPLVIRAVSEKSLQKGKSVSKVTLPQSDDKMIKDIDDMIKELSSVSATLGEYDDAKKASDDGGEPVLTRTEEKTQRDMIFERKHSGILNSGPSDLTSTTPSAGSLAVAYDPVKQKV